MSLAIWRAASVPLLALHQFLALPFAYSGGLGETPVTMALTFFVGWVWSETKGQRYTAYAILLTTSWIAFYWMTANDLHSAINADRGTKGVMQAVTVQAFFMFFGQTGAKLGRRFLQKATNTSS